MYIIYMCMNACVNVFVCVCGAYLHNTYYILTYA